MNDVKLFNKNDIKNFSTTKLMHYFFDSNRKSKDFTEYLSSDVVKNCDAINTMKEIDEIRENSSVNSSNLNKFYNEIIFRINKHGKEVYLYDKNNNKVRSYIIPKKSEFDSIYFAVCEEDLPYALHYKNFEVYSTNYLDGLGYKIDRKDDNSINWNDSFQRYDEVFDFRIDDHSVVKYDGKYGLININGEEIIPPIYEEISFEASNFVKAKKENFYGVLDKKGNIIVDFIYDNIKIPERIVNDKNEPIIVGLNNKYGVVNKNNEIIIPIENKFIKLFHNLNLLLITHNNNKSSLVNFNGKNILPQEYYSKISLFGDNLILARVNNKSGIYNYKGKVIVEPIYDWIVKSNYNDSRGPYRFCINKHTPQCKEGFMDKHGNII